MAYFKFRAKIVNLDGSEIPIDCSIYATTKEEAQKRFEAQLRTENQEYLEIKDFEYKGMHV